MTQQEKDFQQIFDKQKAEKELIEKLVKQGWDLDEAIRVVVV